MTTITVENLAKHLLGSKIKAHIKDVKIAFGELTIKVLAENILTVLSFLKDDKKCRFDQLLTICGVDYPEHSQRFEVVYHLLSMRQNVRLRIKVDAGLDTFIPSATEVFSCANWYEREIWDLYGIKFAYHPDLRRIMTDYGFEGHPLRKDFPLTGTVEVRYDLSEKKVVYEPVSMTQEFRSFDFLSPWSGTEYILPGDEKATKDEK